MKVEYLVPKDVETELRGIMEEMSWFVPAWVREVKFMLGAETEGFAESWTHADYLILKISLNQNWMTFPEALRRSTVIHELAHAHTTPLATAIRRWGDAKLDEKDNEVLKEIVRHNMELSTEHLAWCAEAKAYPYAG